MFTFAWPTLYFLLPFEIFYPNMVTGDVYDILAPTYILVKFIVVDTETVLYVRIERTLFRYAVDWVLFSAFFAIFFFRMMRLFYVLVRKFLSC